MTQFKFKKKGKIYFNQITDWEPKITSQVFNSQRHSFNL